MKFLRIFFLLIVALGQSVAFTAQCAMCKQNAENASQANPGYGAGLNSGITYLMLMPYLLMGVIAFVFWRKKILTFIRS